MPPPDFKTIRYPELRRRPGRRGEIAAAAHALGCSVSHLSRVVRGERASAELLKRYQTWQSANS